MFRSKAITTVAFASFMFGLVTFLFGGIWSLIAHLTQKLNAKPQSQQLGRQFRPLGSTGLRRLRF